MKSEIILDFDSDEFESALELILFLQARLSEFLRTHPLDVFNQYWLPVTEYEFAYRVKCTKEKCFCRHAKGERNYEGTKGLDARESRGNCQLVIPGAEPGEVVHGVSEQKGVCGEWKPDDCKK